MILSDGSIRDAVSGGQLDVEPEPTDNQYQPASLDLRLSDSYLDTLEDKEYNGVGEILVYPGDFFLCETKEKLSIPPHLAGEVTGRSSIGREGVTMHITAGWLDPGWSGSVTLEVANVSDSTVTLTPGERVCQVVFHFLDFAAEVPYGDEKRDSSYQGQSGPTKSRR